MPAYNAAKYIGEAIASVLNQSFTDFELLIINDGSTDATETIIRSFVDERIRLINQTNQGVSAALNMGLMNAKAALVARFDADDICLPNRLRKQYDFMTAHPDYVLVGTDAAYMDMEGNPVFSPEYPAYTNEDIQALPVEVCPFSHTTVIYHKQAVISCGMYDLNAHSFEDHLLWQQLIKLGKVHNMKDVLVKVRFSPDSFTMDEKWRGNRFRKLKYEALKNGFIDKKSGDEIRRILHRQDTSRIKKGSYYSLLSKKYLFNNYNLAKARKNIHELIRTNPMRLHGYGLFVLSLLPEQWLKTVYKIK